MTILPGVQLNGMFEDVASPSVLLRHEATRTFLPDTYMGSRLHPSLGSRPLDVKLDEVVAGLPSVLAAVGVRAALAVSRIQFGSRAMRLVWTWPNT